MLRLKNLLAFILILFISCSDGPREQYVFVGEENPPEDTTQEESNETENGGNDEEINFYSKILNKPNKLLVYYAWPSVINNSGGDVEEAVSYYAKYDYVVLGAGLEEESHGDHEKTVEIIGHYLTRGVEFFGYVDLGVSTSNFTLLTLRDKVANWFDMGVAGIFFDDCGYDYEVRRDRQLSAFEYAHFLGLKIIVNAWDPDDIFGKEYDAWDNPLKLETNLNEDDFYLLESFQIKEGGYQDEEEWQTKMEKLVNYKLEYDFNLLALTTSNDSDYYDEEKLSYAWYSALIYEINGFGWGEHHFSANDGLAPFRDRPGEEVGNEFLDDLYINGSLYWRETDTGSVKIDALNHTCEFIINEDKF